LPALAAAAFDGVVETTDAASPGNEHGHEQPPQQPTGGERCPATPMQDAMIGLNVGVCAEPPESEHRGDRPPAWGEDGARDADVDGRPYRLGKDRGKAPDHANALGRQREPGDPVAVDARCAFTAYRLYLKSPQWIKSS
jgi:hypothetical protein